MNLLQLYNRLRIVQAGITPASYYVPYISSYAVDAENYLPTYDSGNNSFSGSSVAVKLWSTELTETQAEDITTL